MIREREGKKCRLSQDEECHIKPKLKHSGGLNGLTGSKDPVIKVESNGGQTLWKCVPTRAIFLPVTSEGFQALFWGYRHSFWYYYSNVSVASIIKFQFVNHVTETYAFSILSNKVRGLILSAQFIVSMAD